MCCCCLVLLREAATFEQCCCPLGCVLSAVVFGWVVKHVETNVSQQNSALEHSDGCCSPHLSMILLLWLIELS